MFRDSEHMPGALVDKSCSPMDAENTQTISGTGSLFEDEEMLATTDSGDEALSSLLHEYASDPMVVEQPLEQIVPGSKPLLAIEQSNMPLPSPHPTTTAEKRPIMSESEPPLAAERSNLPVTLAEKRLDESMVVFNSTLSGFLLIPLTGCGHPAANVDTKLVYAVDYPKVILRVSICVTMTLTSHLVHPKPIQWLLSSHWSRLCRDPNRSWLSSSQTCPYPHHIPQPLQRSDRSCRNLNHPWLLSGQAHPLLHWQRSD